MQHRATPTGRHPLVTEYIADFQKLAIHHPGPIPASISWQSAPRSTPHLVVGCMVHGDEVGCLPAVLDFFKSLPQQTHPFLGKITIFIGNLPAAQLNKRFVENDLNRVFIDSAPPSTERIRAQEIAPLLKSADLFIDLHQTIEPTDRSFYTFAFNRLNYLWAKYLEGSDTLVTRPAHIKFAEGMLSATELTTQLGIPSITLELDQKGLSALSYSKSLALLKRAIEGLRQLKSTRKVTDIEKLAKKSPDLKLYTRIHNETFKNPQSQLNSGYKNFSEIKKSELMGSHNSTTPIIAPEKGFILFPKYPARDKQGNASAPLPSDIFLVLRAASLSEFK